MLTEPEEPVLSPKGFVPDGMLQVSVNGAEPNAGEVGLSYSFSFPPEG